MQIGGFPSYLMPHLSHVSRITNQSFQTSLHLWLNVTVHQVLKKIFLFQKSLPAFRTIYPAAMQTVILMRVPNYIAQFEKANIQICILVLIKLAKCKLVQAFVHQCFSIEEQPSKIRV